MEEDVVDSIIQAFDDFSSGEKPGRRASSDCAIADTTNKNRIANASTNKPFWGRVMIRHSLGHQFIRAFNLCQDHQSLCAAAIVAVRYPNSAPGGGWK